MVCGGITTRHPFYPASPVNGGPLPKAVPKSGDWSVEGKYNGWRAWVHNPTGAMFNRKLEPLSIIPEFKPALDTLRGLPWEWSDVEALERRHNLARGTLILLDYLPDDPAETYVMRKSLIHMFASVKGIEVHKLLNEPIANDRVYLPMYWKVAGATAPIGDILSKTPAQNPPVAVTQSLWDTLQQCNKALKCGFWEGLVAKRNDSIYPPKPFTRFRISVLDETPLGILIMTTTQYIIGMLIGALVLSGLFIAAIKK